MRKMRKGFTMIELLIVIAILGILAVAVLSAINPLEQIRRGRDTSSRSDAEQLVNALERFYASKGYFPWQTAEGDTAGITWLASTDAATLTSVLGPLIEADEIKTGFTARITKTDANPLYLYYDGSSTSNSVYACFLPQSKSMKLDGGKDCSSRIGQLDFPIGSACPGACTTGIGGTEACNLCLP